MSMPTKERGSLRVLQLERALPTISSTYPLPIDEAKALILPIV
jgi:hypothetical protein